MDQVSSLLFSGVNFNRTPFTYVCIWQLLFFTSSVEELYHWLDHLKSRALISGPSQQNLLENLVQDGEAYIFKKLHPQTASVGALDTLTEPTKAFSSGHRTLEASDQLDELGRKLVSSLEVNFPLLPEFDHILWATALPALFKIKTQIKRSGFPEGCLPVPGGAPRTNLCCGVSPLIPTDLGDFYRSSIGWGFLPGSEATPISGHKKSEQIRSQWVTVWPPIGKAGSLW